MTSRLRLVAAATTLVVSSLAAAPPAGGSATAAPGLHPPTRPYVAAVPAGWPVPPAATASAFLVLDAATGQVLAERNADELRPVASTIKVLTALTVLNRTEPDDVVVIDPEAAAVGGSSVGLRAGEEWTVSQLLDGLIARSGNDAATALAIHVGGSVGGFVELMRADAEALGLSDLSLVTPSGLDDANRLTARDLAVIARAGMSDPRFRAVAAREVVSLPRLGTIETRNELLGRYPGATGIKTGFTDAAGYSLVGAAARDGREVVAVVLGSASSDTRFTEAAALLDHAFGGFTPTEVGYASRLRVAGGEISLTAEPETLLVPTSDPVLTVVTELPIEVPTEPMVRPLDILWQGEALGRIELVTAGDEREELVGGAALGRAMVDRAYAAMRAATGSGAWPR